jgi:hypothetical protein
MIKRDRVGIYNKTEGQKNEYGVWVEGELEFIKNIDVDIQPYSTELLLKEYGYNIQVTKRIFADSDPNINIGTVLKYLNKQNIIENYDVRQIIDWDTHIEVMCYGIY